MYKYLCALLLVSCSVQSVLHAQGNKSEPVLQSPKQTQNVQSSKQMFQKVYVVLVPDSACWYGAITEQFLIDFTTERERSIKNTFENSGVYSDFITDPSCISQLHNLLAQRVAPKKHPQHYEAQILIEDTDKNRVFVNVGGVVSDGHQEYYLAPVAFDQLRMLLTKALKNKVISEPAR